MSSPSPSKPKWSPGGAIRRTSTILSMGRSKTPSRSSSEYEESDRASLKGTTNGVAQKPAAAAPAPASPTPKTSKSSISPKSTLSMEAPSEETNGTPSKSKLARMGTALRRPSSLIPRRRTSSLISSFKDGDSTHSRVSAGRSSADRPVFTAEPDSLVAEPEPHVPEHADPLPHPLPSATKPVDTPSSTIEPEKAVFTEEPEELPPKDNLEQSSSSSSHEEADASKEKEVSAEVATTAEPAPLDAPTPVVGEVGDIEQKTEAIVEPELSPLVIDTAAPADAVLTESVVEQANPIVSVIPTALDTVAEESSILTPTSPLAEPAFTFAPTTLDTVVEESSVLTPISPVAGPFSSVLTPTPDMVVEEPTVLIPTPLVVESGVDVLVPEHTVVKPLREVSSLNSSFEDLGVTAKPTDEELVIVQDHVVAEESTLSSDLNGTVAEEASGVSTTIASVATTIGEKSSSPAERALSTDVSKEDKLLIPEPAPRRHDHPLAISPTVESAAPSPVATQPLLSLEVQATSRQNNAPIAPMRDHHAKRPQEYRSVLSTLFDALLSLIRRWRRGRW